MGKLIEMPYAYRDSRTEGMMDSWKKKMTEEETFLRTGINFYQFNTLFQLLACQTDIKLSKADSLLFIPSYIYYCLTGNKFNETTIASTSQLLGVFSSELDDTIINKLGINASIFPGIVNPGHVIGKLTDPDLYNNQIRAVAVCCHDTASAVAAVPTLENSFAFISAGTWCILGIESEKPLLSKQALKLGITNERAYGNAYRVQKNIVGLWLVQELQKAMAEPKDFSELEKMAMQKHSSQHLIDPEDELFYNPGNMFEAFNHYFEKTAQDMPGSISEYIQCAYTSLSLAFGYYLGKLEELNNLKYETVYVIGGGSQSKYLCQSIANYTKKHVSAGPVECAAIGNIMVQAIASNKIKNLKEGRKMVKKSFTQKVFKPSIPENERVKMFKKFIDLRTQ
ncbi:MAG: rhamnulokinase [Chloroflexia bacterium]|nr:rhamnulokinase [Chloroflexia bacterium]